MSPSHTHPTPEKVYKKMVAVLSKDKEDVNLTSESSEPLPPPAPAPRSEKVTDDKSDKSESIVTVATLGSDSSRSIIPGTITGSDTSASESYTEFLTVTEKEDLAPDSLTSTANPPSTSTQDVALLEDRGVGPGCQMAKEDPTVWQPPPASTVDCVLGPPFPKNFYWWSELEFAHPFIPLDLYQTEYPGAVLLNHECFIPRTGEIRGCHGLAYMHFEPEPIELLETQMKYLKIAIDITEGHRQDAAQDSILANDEIEMLKRLLTARREEIADWRLKINQLKEEMRGEIQAIEEIKEKAGCKMPLLESLREEEEKLHKRTSDLKKVIVYHDEAILDLKCRGCEGDPEEYLRRLENLKDEVENKKSLVEALKDEKEQVVNVMQVANRRLATCIQELRQVNEMVVEMGGGGGSYPEEDGNGKKSKSGSTINITIS